MPKPWRLPLTFSGFLLLSQAFPLPSPVRDAATGAWVGGFSLHLPFYYIVFAPFCGIADRLTLLSFHQVMVFLVYAGVACLLLRKPFRIATAFILFLGFLVWGGAVLHPMARLEAQDPDVLLIDFHSHSRVSHDGRPSFTAERNMRWHQLQGFNAAFITDHNRVESSQEAGKISSLDWKQTGYRSLQGEEISLWKTHLVVLGNHSRIDNQPFDSDPKKVGPFIQAMHRRGLPVIASLPEYWWYHWGQGVQDFVHEGISGFEIINSAPRALDFPPAYRREIVDLCRTQNLFMTGISDNHGYGYATAVWNAVRLPGWEGLDPDQLEVAVLNTLRMRRFAAVEVLERARYNPETYLGLLISPLINAEMYWRSLQVPEAVSWVLWIWVIYGLRRVIKKRHV